MRVGVIDIGTNSTRLLITDVQESKTYPVLSLLETTRIGEGMGRSKEIKEHVLKRTLDCLLMYKEKCENLNVENVYVIATSAVRDASNKDIVKKKIKEVTGFDVKIIKGEEEARLSYLGAVSDEIEKASNPLWVVDIGGGSTELVYPNDNLISYQSINLGAVRLAENKEMERADNLLENLVKDKKTEKFELIGVGGTITSLAAIMLKLDKYDPNLVQGYELRLSDVKNIYKTLSDMDVEERKKVKGLQPERADIITFGIYILMKLMDLLECKKIIVSEKDILYGVIIDSFTGQNYR